MFYTTKDWNDFSTCFVRKTVYGYKYIYGGTGEVRFSAKIINAKDKRIWLIYMNKFQGSDFEIIGLSADGKELTRIKDNISPRYAE